MVFNLPNLFGGFNYFSYIIYMEHNNSFNLDLDLITKLHSEGKSADFIAAQLFVSKQTILRRFAKLGLYPNFKLGSSKQCVCCKETKNIGEFYWRQKSRNSKDSHCKDCAKIRDKIKRDNLKKTRTEDFYNNIDFNKKCNRCFIEKHCSEFYKGKQTSDGFRHMCKTCYDKDVKRQHKCNFNLFQKHTRANKSGVKFAINENDLQYPLNCPLLDIPLNYDNPKAGAKNAPSLDKIIPELGYVPGNVIIMSRLANTMKNCANLKQLRKFSENIIKLIDKIETDGALGDITDIFPHVKLKEE